MSATENPSNRDQELDAAIAAYYRAVEAGRPPDRDAFLGNYPDVREELESFLADKAAFERQVAVDAGATLPPGPPVSDAPGSTLGVVRYFGDYEILAEIARGGMGVVYCARQVSLNRTVALKMILTGQLASPADVQRFRIEAEAAANLDHPNILPVYEVGEHEGQQYFSMKLIAGGSLADRMKEFVGRPRDAVGVVAAVARAVQHAHQRGVLHRDLKPANILLDAVDTPFVTDFGLAKRVEGDGSLTQPGAIVGTPSYMAPEQARAEKQLTTAADVYALGAILYECLTGRPPFVGTTPFDTVMQVLEKEPLRPSNADRDLVTVAMKCLEKEPGKRYESAAALAYDLDRWQRGEPITARPTTVTERTWRWCRRNPVLSAAWGTAALGLIAAATVSVAFGILQRQTAIQAAQSRDDLSGALAEVSAQKTRADERTELAERRLAENYLDRGNVACNANDPKTGMVWFAESLKLNPGDAAIDRAARANLGYWHKPPQLLSQYENNSEVRSVTFSPNGKTILVGCTDGTAQIWDIASRMRVGPPLKHRKAIRAVAFSPDGKHLITGSEDGTAKIWDAATGLAGGWVLKHPAFVASVAFSSDGKCVATGCYDRKARIWDTENGKMIGAPIAHRSVVMSVVFIKDGSALVTGSDDGTARMWDTMSGRPLGTPLVHGNPVSAAIPSPDGKFILTASDDWTAQLWDAATGKPIGQTIRQDGILAAAAFSPDGHFVVIGSWDGTARVWEVMSGRQVGPSLVHGGKVQSVAYSPDGIMIITGSADHTTRIWRLPPLRQGTPERVSLEVTVDTCKRITGGIVTTVNANEYFRLQEELEKVGGPKAR